MKKRFLIPMTLCLMAMLGACGKQDSKTNDVQSKSTVSTSSSKTNTKTSDTKSSSKKSTSTKSFYKSSAKHKKAAMNLEQIQAGDYSSLLDGKWKMIGAKINYHKGNGLEFDTSETSGKLSVTKDEIFNDQLNLRDNNITIDGDEIDGEVQNDGKTVTVSSDSVENKNGAVTFYPVGTTSEYQVDSNGGTNKKNLITVWISDDNYTEVFEQETSDNNVATSNTHKKNGTLWSASKDQELEAFVDKWSETMDQDYQKYDGVNDLEVSVGMTYPSGLAKETVDGQQASVGWSKDGKGNYEYNVVAIYNHDGDLPPLPNRITYCFAFHNGQPVVLVDQSRQGTPNLQETQNAKLKAGFNQIAGN